MRSISHQVKSYRRRFRLFPSYVFRSRIFVLVALLTLLLTAAILLTVVSSVVGHSTGYAFLPWVVLIFEIPLVFGFLQLFLEANHRRYLRARPGTAEPGFRVALMSTEREKIVAIEQLFGKQPNFETLAHALIQRWEWERSIAEKSADPIVRKARGFFGFPQASNLATYLGGLLAVVAAIVVTMLDKDTFYAQLPSLFDDVGELTWLITKLVVFPLAVVVIPMASILGTVRSAVVRTLEKINDDYLSEASFYAFIKELLELEERKTRRLLMVTTGLFYWAIRIGTAPLRKVPKLYVNMGRSRRIGRIRRRRLSSLCISRSDT